MQVRFSGCGERFAGIGEGGVVATWRLDAPRYVASDTGPLGRADWACQVCFWRRMCKLSCRADGAVKIKM